MNAIILVGGQGTRLRPLTDTIPKAAVPLLNQPFIINVLLYIQSHGIKDVVLAMGYNPDPIKRVLSDVNNINLTVHYSLEDKPLGTAGAVKNAEHLLDDMFLVFNGDIYTDINLTEMIEAHKRVKPKVTIALTPVDNPTLYGVIETDKDNMIQRFVEKPSWDQVTTNRINAGIYIIESEVLGDIPAASPYMFEHGLFPSLLERRERMLAYYSDKYWIDIGTPEKYLKANHDILVNNFGQRVKISDNCNIASSAIVEGPVLIADGCIIEENAIVRGPSVLGANCNILNDAVIESSVLWNNITVESSCSIKNSIISAASKIGARVSLEDCVIAENVVVKPSSIIERGSTISC